MPQNNDTMHIPPTKIMHKIEAKIAPSQESFLIATKPINSVTTLRITNTAPSHSAPDAFTIDPAAETPNPTIIPKNAPKPIVAIITFLYIVRIPLVYLLNFTLFCYGILKWNGAKLNLTRIGRRHTFIVILGSLFLCLQVQRLFPEEGSFFVAGRFRQYLVIKINRFFIIFAAVSVLSEC